MKKDLFRTGFYYLAPSFYLENEIKGNLVTNEQEGSHNVKSIRGK